MEVDSGLSGTFTPGRLPLGVVGPASMAVRMDTPSSENCLADAGNADDGRSCDDDDHNQKEGGNNDYNRDRSNSLNERRCIGWKPSIGWKPTYVGIFQLECRLCPI